VATAVNILFIEPRRNFVSSVTGVPASRSARPQARCSSGSSPRATSSTPAKASWLAAASARAASAATAAAWSRRGMRRSSGRSMASIFNCSGASAPTTTWTRAMVSESSSCISACAEPGSDGSYRTSRNPPVRWWKPSIRSTSIVGW
jgi:hypothetical protein